LDPKVLQKLLLLSVAGALGTLARYELAGLVQRLAGASFPLGTFVVNVAGCFVAGLLWALFEARWAVTGETRIIVLVGFMGAFTTFSAFILETTELLRASQWFYAGLNLILQNALGISALFLGAFLGRSV